jgi:peptidoglycan/xylan/chitin deacetylase (PgdA/CDA1 family)
VSVIKGIARGLAIHTVARTAPIIWRWRRRGSLVVLMYHRVLPQGSSARSTEQPGMYVSPETLDLHLTELRKDFELVHLNEWLQRAKQGSPLPERACALTFDDGWRDNYEFGLPVLAKHGAPATIFLVSSYIGTTYRFWPNRLMRLLQKSFAEPGSVTYPESLRRLVAPALAAATDRGELRADDADVVVQGAKRWEEEKIRSLVDTAEESCGGTSEAGEILDGEEIAKLSASGLVRFGSHTATHFRLGGRISAQDMEREIVGSQKRLQDLTGQAIDLFCYPNGETSPGAVDLVRRHYLGAVTTRKGWHRASNDPQLIRRVGVHEEVSNAREPFLACLSGWI